MCEGGKHLNVCHGGYREAANVFTATSMTMIRVLKKNKQKILFYEK